MARPPLAQRSVIYTLLIAASFLFVVPFAWLVITSLKPNEQAMTMPPQWIPRGYYAEIEGQRIEVTKDFTVNQPGVVAEELQGEHVGQRNFFSLPQLAASGNNLRVLYRVEPGWWHITERIEPPAERNPRWVYVPASAISSRVVIRWNNYYDALSRLDGGVDSASSPNAKHRVTFWRFLGNSLTICILGVLGTVFSNAIVAYGFSRIRWRGRDAFFALTLATLMVPFPVLMVPLYSVFKTFGWIGTLLPLWVPAWFGSAFNIFLMRQFFLGIPEELSEAARIDGCSEWRIFWRIILPLSKPVLATAALFHFLYAWNDFMGPLLYLTRKETFPLSLALQSFQAQNGGVQWHHLMAASAVTMFPVIVLFFFAQKTFIRGIATTGSKS